MSKYTIELRKIIDTLGEDEVKSWFMNYDLHDYLTDDEIAVIEKRGTFSKEKLAKKMKMLSENIGNCYEIDNFSSILL